MVKSLSSSVARGFDARASSKASRTVARAGPSPSTAGVLAFVASWNGYLLSLLVLGSPDAQTLPLGTARAEAPTYAPVRTGP